MKRALASFLFCFAASLAESHVAPMYPIEMDVRCDGDRLRLEMDASAPEWVEDVLNLQSYPSGEWTDDLKMKSEKFVNSHFELSTQNRLIPGHVMSGKVLLQPWQSPASARVRIHLVYDLPPGGDALNGKAFFFKAEWDLHEGAGKPVEGLVRRFETILTVRGARSSVVTVPIRQPDFLFELKDLRRSSSQQWGESFWRGGAFRGTLFLWGLLLGLVVMNPEAHLKMVDGLPAQVFLHGQDARATKSLFHQNCKTLLLAGIGYAGGLLAAAFQKLPHFPFDWLGCFLGAGLILLESRGRWLLWAMALMSGALIGAGVAAAGKGVGSELGFDQLSIPFFAAGAFFPVILGALPGVFLPWVSERMAAARGSDRGPEQRETLRKTLAASIAAVSLVWLIRGFYP